MAYLSQTIARDAKKPEYAGDIFLAYLNQETLNFGEKDGQIQFRNSVPSLLKISATSQFAPFQAFNNGPESVLRVWFVSLLSYESLMSDTENGAHNFETSLVSQLGLAGFAPVKSAPDRSGNRLLSNGSEALTPDLTHSLLVTLDEEEARTAQTDWKITPEENLRLLRNHTGVQISIDPLSN